MYKNVKNGYREFDHSGTLKAVIQQGWPGDKSALPPMVSPYFNMTDEISIQDGLSLSGSPDSVTICMTLCCNSAELECRLISYVIFLCRCGPHG